MDTSVRKWMYVKECYKIDCLNVTKYNGPANYHRPIMGEIVLLKSRLVQAVTLSFGVHKRRSNLQPVSSQLSLSS